MRLLCEDEARFGRLSRPHRGWAPQGLRPEGNARIVREYEHAYAAVSPHDGARVTRVLPEVNAEAMSGFLAEVSRRRRDEVVVRVLDGAGWHTAQRLVIPDNVRLVPLPPWSPPLSPTEPGRDEVRGKESPARLFARLDEVEGQWVTALATLASEAPRVASLCGFDWITCGPLTADWYRLSVLLK